jgi:hypothetical protein
MGRMQLQVGERERERERERWREWLRRERVWGER